MALLAVALDVVLGVQTEIVIFLIALIMHTVLFGSYRLGPKSAKLKLKKLPEAPPLRSSRSHKSTTLPGADVLAKSSKELLRQGASCSAMVQELGTQIRENHANAVCPALASILESVGNNASFELVAAVREILREHHLAPTPCLAELLLKNLLVLRSHDDFKEVLAEIEAANGVTTAVAIFALRSSLALSDLDAALELIQRFAAPLKAGLGASPSSASQQLVQQLIQLSLQQESMPALLDRLAGCGLLRGWALEAALKACAPRGSTGRAGLSRELEELSRKHGVELTDAAHALLVRGAGTAEDALRVFANAVGRRPAGKDLLLAALDASIAHRSSALTEAVVQQLPEAPPPDVAAALVRAIAEGPLRGEDAAAAVLRAYEGHLAGVDLLADARAGRAVAEAALRCKRPELLERLLRSAAEPRLVGLLRSFAAEHRLADATAVFRACPEKPACLYNTLLDACVDCQDMELAERIMAEAVAAGAADVVTYNTIVKKHLQRGQFQRARAVLEQMRSAGGSVAPNAVTFNELIDATVRANSEGTWVLIDEMRACGVQPTTVTASILLKSIQRSSRASDVERIMAFVEELGDVMDEVLLSSVCEACIRGGRADLLAGQLRRQRGSRGIRIGGAHTFGSVIRAYGFIGDLEGAWETWGEMRTREIVPTSITIGCMVEALVSNGDPEAGLRLIHELLADGATRPLLNAVVYCSVLKGFTHRKAFDRVWAVYDEMIRAELQFSIVTYNALVDACARAGEMARVQPLMQDMARDKIEPNVVTYSTIVKGYCQEGRLDKAFELLEAMKTSTCFRPDEITYNTLIDGCAQRGMFEQGMKLLHEMQEAGVSPSCFTLSVVVKLASRAKKPERAFELADELSRKYHLQPNVHVYDNLVHACTSHGDLRGALQVLERMQRQRVRPDARTYSLLLRGLVEAGEFAEAACLVRLACGIRGSQPPPRLAGLASGQDAKLLQPKGGLSAELLAEVLEAMARRGGEGHLAVQLCKELRSVPGVRLDPRLSLSLTSRALRG